MCVFDLQNVETNSVFADCGFHQERFCSCIFYAMINFDLFSSELCSEGALPLLTFLKLYLCFSSASNSKSYPEFKSVLAMCPPSFHLS